MPDITWRIIDFRPCPTGWRVAYLTNDENGDLDGGYELVDMPGWLIRERASTMTWEDLVNDENRPGDRLRDVVPGVYVDGAVIEADGGLAYENFWYVLSPGDSPPTEAESKRAARRRKELRAELDRIREARRQAGA